MKNRRLKIPWYEVCTTTYNVVAIEAESESSAFAAATGSGDYDEMYVDNVYEDAEDISRLHRHADKIIWDMK